MTSCWMVWQDVFAEVISLEVREKAKAVHNASNHVMQVINNRLLDLIGQHWRERQKWLTIQSYKIIIW